MSVDKIVAVRQELGDILIYLVRLADRLGVNLVTAAKAKLEMNKKKYPADRVRGRADKYTAYGDADAND